MIQQEQVFELKRARRERGRLWAYRYRVGGRGSRRVQRGGFASEEDAAAALERELERVRRERRVSRNLTLAELVDVYLAQHTFDLSRYMAASLTMIDRHYGHLARDGREHAIRLLDELSAEQRPPWTRVDARWTLNQRAPANGGNTNSV